jgi:ABC-2 type transport system permease protein
MKQHSIFSVYKNQLLSFVRKEFYHVLRDRKVLLILFGMPVVQVLLFGFVLSNEVKNSKIIVVDYAKDAVSQAIITKISASHYFDVINQHIPHHQIDEAFKEGKIKAAVVFPENLNQQLLHQQRAQVQLILDATDVNTANTINGYLSAIIYDYVVLQNKGVSPPFQIISETRMLYNPELKGAPNFVPGVMAMVLLLVCVLMTAVAIVKEKEMGTMEVLLVSPIKPFLIIISKAIPYLLLSFINLLSILLVSVYILDVPIRGSVMLLLAESTLFIITCLSLGILISIRTSSQQVAMLISLVGMLLPTLMLSGFMFPIENMPYVLQLISNIVPSRWYYIIVKDVMIKGAGFSSIWQETIILVVMTVVLLVASLKNFKIRLA